MKVHVLVVLVAAMLGGCFGEDPYDRLIAIRQGIAPDSVVHIEFNAGSRDYDSEVFANIRNQEVIAEFFHLVATADEWEVRGEVMTRSYTTYVFFDDGRRASMTVRFFPEFISFGIYEDDVSDPRAAIRYYDIELAEQELSPPLARVLEYLALPRAEQSDPPMNID